MSFSIGVYDFNGTFGSQTDLAWDHYFVDWNNVSGITALCNASAAKSRWPLITLQPQSDAKITKMSSTYLTDISSGKYDKYIMAFIGQIKAYGGPIGIRFMHEFDLEANYGRYPWAVPIAQVPEWIAAYQRFVTIVQSYTHAMTQKYFIWSPVGNNICKYFWPGNSFLDFVGCSVYAWDRYTEQFYLTTDGSFANIFTPKYNLLSTFGRQIIVTEIGIETEDNQATWVVNAFSAMSGYPLVSSVVYFNAYDSVPWVPGGPVPDWSISTSIWHV